MITFRNESQPRKIYQMTCCPDDERCMHVDKKRVIRYVGQSPNERACLSFHSCQFQCINTHPWLGSRTTTAHFSKLIPNYSATPSVPPVSVSRKVTLSLSSVNRGKICEGGKTFFFLFLAEVRVGKPFFIFYLFMNMRVEKPVYI